MADPSLADLRAFAAIVEHRSFRAAADALGVSRSALSHSMRGLERELGVRMLHRTTRSVSPTEVGSRLLERLRPVLGELAEVIDAVSEHSGMPSGTVRINSSEAGARLLLDIIPAFLTRCPAMSVDLVVDGRLVDIVEQGFDAGVRLGEAVPRDMIAVPIGPDFRFVPIAAPSYLEGRVPPRSPDDLRNHACIRQRLPSGKAYRWEFARQGQEATIDVPGPITLNDTPLMVEAAVNGMGIAFVPEHAARAQIDAGRLITLLDEWCPLVPGLHLYYAGRRHIPAGLRALVSVIRSRDTMQGRRPELSEMQS